MAEKVVHDGNCFVTIKHPDGRVQELGANDRSEYAHRKITVTDGGQTVIERRDSGRITIAPSGAQIDVSTSR